MTINVKSGGTWRTPTQIWVKAGGVWRNCVSVWIKAGGTWRQVFTSGPSVIANSGDIAGNTQVLNSGTSTAQVNFLSTGGISKTTAPFDDSIGFSTAWLSAVGAGNGNNFWIRANLVSGSLTTGTLNTWLRMNATNSFSKSATGGGQLTVQLSFDFATDAAGTNIVSTGNTWFLRSEHAPP